MKPTTQICFPATPLGKDAAPPVYNRGLHRVALLTTMATFPLIFMGGLVTSKQAGMSVPDWPNSFGYNMFLFPPSQWVGGIFYEHTHRLMGTVVGMLSIVLCVWAWRTDARRYVRWLCTLVLAGVIVQGVLGGLRVVLVQIDLAIVHACLAQAFFCLAAATAVATSRWWTEVGADPTPLCVERSFRVVGRIALLAVAVIYLQLVVGAIMRHNHAGLALTDLPTSNGARWLPPTTKAELMRMNARRVFRYDLDAVSMGQVWVHFAHRVGAVLVALFTLLLVLLVALRHRHFGKLLAPALLLLALVAGQVTLGLYTVMLRKPADVASAHVAVGALVLLTTFVLAVRAGRLAHLQARAADAHRHAVRRNASSPPAPPRDDRDDRENQSLNPQFA